MKLKAVMEKHYDWANRDLSFLKLTIGDFREKVCLEIGRLVVDEEFPHGQFTKAAATGKEVGRLEGLHGERTVEARLNDFVVHAALDILALREGCVVYPENRGEGICVFKARKLYDHEVE